VLFLVREPCKLVRTEGPLCVGNGERSGSDLKAPGGLNDCDCAVFCAYSDLQNADVCEMHLLVVVGLRRGTVRTIEKITGTMKLVAQAQLLGTMKKARETANFFLNVKAMTDKFPQGTPAEGEKDKVLSVAITSNRGLCGSLNSQLIRDLLRMPEVTQESNFVVMGDKGATVRGRRAGRATTRPWAGWMFGSLWASLLSSCALLRHHVCIIVVLLTDSCICASLCLVIERLWRRELE